MLLVGNIYEHKIINIIGEINETKKREVCHR